MIRKFPLVLAFGLVLVACNTPGRHFEGLPATRVRIGEMHFDVRVRGELAEAMRINAQWAPRLSGVADPAALAMAHVSGCRVTEIRGDQSLVLGILDCGDRATTHHMSPVVTEFDCYVVDRWKSRGLNQRTTILDCDPPL